MNKLLLPLLVLLLAMGCQPEEQVEKPLFVTYNTFDEIAPLFNQQSDSTYVINFWATWCKPCIEELPYFEQLHEGLADEKVRIILVSMDFEKDVEPRLIPFLEEQKLSSDIALLLDGKYNSWIDRVEPQWDGAIPVTLIYNAKEKRFHNKQFASYQQLEDLVKEIL
jgi:thiol-disulfide isomerase/thioredoxin